MKEIESWRENLAKNIAIRNTSLTNSEINFAVQRTVDRIIFLRICEDRGIDEYQCLLGLINGPNIYGRLCELYQKADARYNSGLFHFQNERGRSGYPDELTLKLQIDDKVLKSIIKGLYYPECPYEFSVLPASILGQVYEQFLGKVIHLTAGHHAKIEDKPEVKKAGGVYYTPEYIVDYIVSNTLGKLLEGKTPRQVEKIKVLDPACGSGSFLIVAYQKLVDWHLDYYVKSKQAKHRKLIYQGPDADWRLATSEKKRILTNNIFGVDIDSQAVEVSKLSLLLKVLENETSETINAQLKLFHERVLPDLSDNIKCGNSLIGPDFYDGQQMSLLDGEEIKRINVFDWNAEFSDIMKAGGFDVVIGNPPYVRIQGFPAEQISYFAQTYKSATGNFDLYIPFLERGFHLLHLDGLLGMITPNKFLQTDYGKGLRRLLSAEKGLNRLVDFGAHQVFAATTYTCLIFLQRGDLDNFYFAKTAASEKSLASAVFESRALECLSEDPWTLEDENTAKLVAKLEVNAVRLLDLPADMSRGSSTGDDEVFVVETGTTVIEAQALRIPVFASDFGRYRFLPEGKWQIIFPYEIVGDKSRLISELDLKSRLPKTFAYLYGHQIELKRRKQFKHWFGYSAPRNLKLHDRADIAVPLLANRGLFTLIPGELHGCLCPMASGGFTIALGASAKVRPEYVLGVLNSKLLFWRLSKRSNIFRGGWVTCTKQYFGELPIRDIDIESKSDLAMHDNVVKLVDQMLTLNKKQVKSSTPHDKDSLQRQIDATDRQIDQLVYKLYGLTEEEIKIVEEAEK